MLLCGAYGLLYKLIHHQQYLLIHVSLQVLSWSQVLRPYLLVCGQRFDYSSYSMTSFICQEVGCDLGPSYTLITLSVVVEINLTILLY